MRKWRPAVEAGLAALIIGTVEPYDSSLLPYLITPALSAGLIGGWSLAIIGTLVGGSIVASLIVERRKDSTLSRRAAQAARDPGR